MEMSHGTFENVLQEGEKLAGELHGKFFNLVIVSIIFHCLICMKFTNISGAIGRSQIQCIF